jgi:exosortase
MKLWRSLSSVGVPCSGLAFRTSLVVVALGLLYAPVVSGLIYQWRVDADYSYGPLIVAASAYLLWRKRADLSRCLIATSAIGYPLLLTGLALFVLGEAAAIIYIMRVSLLVTVVALILFLSGPLMLKIAAFPLAYLLFAIPLPYIVYDRLTLPLQFLASDLAASTLDAFGIPVLRDGNVITLATVQFGVTEACSGIRSLLSLAAMSVLYAHFAFPTWWKRAIIIVSAIPIAVVTNTARIVLTGILATWLGPRAAMGFYHTFSGLIIFVLAVALIAIEGVALSMVSQGSGGRWIHAAES